ncbi:MAG: hypothetical protein IJY08_06645 [Clostridia bacterium]|nr:hypothetical protein [Clostridia bacterium]
MRKICVILAVVMLICLLGACGRDAVDMSGESVIGEKAYSETSALLLGDGYLDFVKSDYDKDGHLLKEHIFGANHNFLCHFYIDHEYDRSGKLLRSVKYCEDYSKPYARYTMEYEVDSYYVYTYDEDGRAVMGTKYTGEGRSTDHTVVLEYYDDGTIKSRGFYEDHYLTYLMEYDSLGRCVYQKTVGISNENTATLEYDGVSGNVRVIDRLVYDKHVVVSVEYDESGNIILLNEDHESLDKKVVRALEYYDGTDRIKSYQSTTASEYYDDKGGNLVVSTTSSQTSYVYTDSGRVKEFYSSDDGDGISYETLFEYNAEDRLCKVSSTNYYYDGKGDASVITYEYDEAGNRICVVTKNYLADGTPLESSSVVVKSEFDQSGNETKKTVWHGEVLYSETNHRYDAAGNQIWTSYRYYDNATLTPPSALYERTFDAWGNCIKEIRTNYHDSDLESIEGTETGEWRYDEKGNMLWSSYSYKNSKDKYVYYESTYNVRGCQIAYTETITERNGTRSVYEIKYDHKGERVDSTYKKYDAKGNVIYSGKTPDDYGKG